jgi:shikimate dehydrogenase
VVKATPIVLYPDTTGRVRVDFDSLEPGTIARDVIPNPPRTLFIKEAEACGCNILDGLGMLVNQSAIAIKNWSVLKPATGVTRRAIGALFANTVESSGR